MKVSAKEKEVLKHNMELAGMSNMSAYIRKMLNSGRILNLDLPELKEIGSLLRISSNNINQLAKRANTDGSIYQEDITEVKTQLEEIRIYFGKFLSELSILE